jgi:lysozyme
MKIRSILIIISSIIVLSISGYLLSKILITKPKKISTIKGIDISNKYPGILDWDKLGENKGFVILRAVRSVDTVKTKGKHSFVSMIDSNFKKNWLELKSEKIVRGAYHRFSANIPAEKQFEIFKNGVDLKKGDLPPFLDIEENASIIEVNKWIQLAKEQYKVEPIIYDNYDHYLKHVERLKNFKIWIYLNPRIPIEPQLKKINNVVILQNKQNVLIPGFNEWADLNEFLGDSVAFKALLIK